MLVHHHHICKMTKKNDPLCWNFLKMATSSQKSNIVKKRVKNASFSEPYLVYLEVKPAKNIHIIEQ